MKQGSIGISGTCYLYIGCFGPGPPTIVHCMFDIINISHIAQTYSRLIEFKYIILHNISMSIMLLENHVTSSASEKLNLTIIIYSCIHVYTAVRNINSFYLLYQTLILSKE